MSEVWSDSEGLEVFSDSEGFEVLSFSEDSEGLSPVVLVCDSTAVDVAVQVPDKSDDQVCGSTAVDVAVQVPDMSVEQKRILFLHDQLDTELSVYDLGGVLEIRGDESFSKYDGVPKVWFLRFAIHLYDTKEYSDAFVCFCILAKAGMPIAWYFLGSFFYYGHVVEKDDEKAIPCFMKAAYSETGNWNSELLLARIFITKGEFSHAAWFYHLSYFHGSTAAYVELLDLKRKHGREATSEIDDEQAREDLQQAKLYRAQGNYLKAMWSFHLADFRGDLDALAELQELDKLLSE
jgi:hypothetical protein